jgi:membrane-associated phospholipid phosphatase
MSAFTWAILSRTTASAVHREARADAALRWALGVFVAYFLLLLPAILILGGGPWSLAATHVAILGAVAAAARSRSTQPAVRTFRDWLPALLILVVYVELNAVIAAMGHPHMDDTVVGWERALFPSDPSRSLAVSLHSAWISEPLHAAYLSYYLIVFVPQLILYVTGRRRAFAATTLALSVVTVICAAVFVAMPVDGPRYFGGADAPDGPIRRVVLSILAGGSSRGTAFPSMHVAASVVASVCALRSQRPVGVVVAILTVGLSVGAVYGGFHYAVDAVAGATAAFVALGVAAIIWRALPDEV